MGETIGFVAIVVSLIFLGVQLKQDQVITRSELGSGSFEGIVLAGQNMNNPEFAAIYAKMLQAPQKLSVEEMIRVNAFLGQVSDAMARECYLAHRGIFVECEQMIRDGIRRYFGNAYAQAWWRLSDTRAGIELPDWVDEAIYNAGSDVELQRIKSIQDEVSETGQ